MRLFSLLQDLFWSSDKGHLAVFSLCQQLNVPVTKSFIQDKLEEHPNFPSLLSVSDVLNSVGVENVSVKTDFDSLRKLPLPFIAQIRIDEQSYFAVISKIENGDITFLHPFEHRNKDLPLEEFRKIYNGIVLIADKSENAGQKDYATHFKKEKRLLLAKRLSAVTIPVITFLACSIVLLYKGSFAIPSILYTLLSLIGVLIGYLLLWYEVDRYNPTLQQICSSGKKVNCGAILNSNASKIFGVSWSVIGFTYFAGDLLSLLVTGIYNLSTIFALGWLNLFALPYIIFSFYYQARIAKQWCLMCVMVQIILLLQFLVALWGRFYFYISLFEISSSTIIALVCSFSITFLIVNLILPVFAEGKKLKLFKLELQRLKHNPQIFEALLPKQKTIIESTAGLGISLGNPHGKYKIVKVCNPYCGPCASAHAIIDELIEENSEINAQIIFTAVGESHDPLTPPVQHLLAIAEKGNKNSIKNAMDDWYLADEKDYDAFAIKYPIELDLNGQNPKIKAMNKWCKKTGIDFTPTFFINGYQLPEIYSIDDLKYFLTV